MKGSRALAAGLALAAMAGCGFSTGEIIKPRYPAGGQDQGPDVHNRMVDKLRTVDITVAAKRFQPQQTSVGLDSVVRIINGSKRPVKLRLIKLVGHQMSDTTLAPGEVIEREYLHKGVEVWGLQGSRARLEIDVYPSA
jgi:hypothetical protein